MSRCSELDVRWPPPRDLGRSPPQTTSFGRPSVALRYRPRFNILLWTLFALSSLGQIAIAEDAYRYPEGKHGRGELFYHQNIPVLIVRGTHAEIGDQIGTLALKPADKAMKLVEGFAAQQIPAKLHPIADAAMQALYARFPLRYRQELEAMAAASGVPEKSLIIANTIIDLEGIIGCSSLLVSSTRSATGGPLYGRNMDLPYVKGLAQFSLLIVYQPDRGHAFAMPNLPGFLMLASGMNDCGLALGSQSVGPPRDGSPRFSATGVPSAVAARRLMEECKDLDSAAQWLEDNRLIRCVTIAASDRKRQAVFEITTKRMITRSDKDGVSCATNHFRTAELAANTTCWRYEKLEGMKKDNRLDLTAIANALDAVNQGKLTVHSMIFEPKVLRLHLSMGPGPVTGKPLTMIDLSEYFHRN